jgi:cysteine desulfurase
MVDRIYLDYNATTPLDPRVVQAIAQALEIFGNPSSIHADGREARALVDGARSRIAQLLHCNHRQIIFTSGGTESNNLAILGAARGLSGKGRHVITTAIEHSAVLNSCHQLEREGFNVTYVTPGSDGVIEAGKIQDAIRTDTILISVMMANNEIGTIQPIREIAEAAHRFGIVTHTDAVQAFGKIEVRVEELGVDLLSISAHKIYGPK